MESFSWSDPILHRVKQFQQERLRATHLRLLHNPVVWAHFLEVEDLVKIPAPNQAEEGCEHGFPGACSNHWNTGYAVSAAAATTTGVMKPNLVGEL